MLLLVATVLTAAPLSPFSVPAPAPGAAQVSRPRGELRTRLSLGGLLGASWYVEPGRRQIEAALDNTKGSLFGDGRLDGQTLLLAAPVVGPMLLARQGAFDDADKALLVTSGVLQLMGLSVGAWRLATEDVGTGASADAPTLSFSPIAGGRLGLSVQLTGF